MAFRVEVAPRAFEDLDEIAEYIKRKSDFRQAEEWFNGIIAAIQSLSEMPGRCPIASESRDLKHEIRVLLHGRRNRTYKVYFSIERSTRTSGKIYVFHVRHWARRALSGREIGAVLDESQE